MGMGDDGDFGGPSPEVTWSEHFERIAPGFKKGIYVGVAQLGDSKYLYSLRSKYLFLNHKIPLTSRWHNPNSEESRKLAEYYTGLDL